MSQPWSGPVPATAQTLAPSHGEPVFIRVWALANVSHILIQWGGNLALPTLVNLAVAVVVFAHPRSARALALLALAQIVDTAVLMPDTPDHQYLASLVNLALVVAYVIHRPSHAQQLVTLVAPTARWVLLTAYSAAVLSKYNLDFLDASRSCAAYIGHAATFGTVALGGLTAQLFVIGTIAGETMVLTLLVIPRTRRWGVLFGVAFHFCLSLSPAVSVADFSATLWALFLLFLPREDRAALASRIGDEWQRGSIGSHLAKWSPRVSTLVLIVFVCLVAQSNPAGAIAVWLLTTLLAPWLLYHLFCVLKEAPSRKPGRLGRPPMTQVASVVAVVALAASPYLGFGTSSRFTMFSSLRTEGPGTNHLFMPSVHVIDSQNEYLLVERVYGSSAALEQAHSKRAAIPTVEVRRALSDRSVGGVFVAPDGARVVVRPNSEHELRTPAPWWERKTQHYRSFRLTGVTVSEFCSN
jgi:hypothetical protein